MIRAKVNITGTITKEAVVRTDKNHKSYLSFILTVRLSDPKISQKEVNIFVAMYNGKQEDLSILTIGKQVVVSGEMDIHKKEDFSFYLNAEKYESLYHLLSLFLRKAWRGVLQYMGKLYAFPGKRCFHRHH